SAFRYPNLASSSSTWISDSLSASRVCSQVLHQRKRRPMVRAAFIVCSFVTRVPMVGGRNVWRAARSLTSGASSAAFVYSASPEPGHVDVDFGIVDFLKLGGGNCDDSKHSGKRMNIQSPTVISVRQYTCH